MTSVFTIHPKDGTDVVCTLGDTGGVPYVVVDADFNEARREQIVYSEGSEGGSVQNVSRNTAQASITVAILGANEAEVASRVRTISQAFRWTEGGTIEYKPTAYTSSTEHTYYHYLRSSPPAKVSGSKAAALSGAYQYGEIFRFDIQIQAWATTDPDILLTLLGETTVDNRNDASGSNYASALSSNMKGDAFIPHIKITPVSATFKPTVIYLQMIEVPIGIADPNDTFDLDDLNSELGETFQADATAWGGGSKRSNGSTLSMSDSLETVFGLGITWKKHNFGKVTLIFRARVQDDTTTWDVQFHLYESLNVSAELLLSSTEATTVSTPSGVSWRAFDTTALDFPPFPTPERLSDITTPTFGDNAVNNLAIRVTGWRTAGSGWIELDAVMICRSEKFLSKYVMASGVGPVNVPMITSAVENASYGAGFWTVTRHPHDVSWDKFGPPLSDMIMHKGKDYILRVIADSPIFGYEETTDIVIEVCGIHATIYPFEVS